MLPEHIKNELRHNERAIKVSYASARDAEFVRGVIRRCIAKLQCDLYDSGHMIGVVVGYYIDTDCDFAIVRPVNETLSNMNPEYVIPNITFDSDMKTPMCLMGFTIPTKAASSACEAMFMEVD